jgi:hypothetical protein
MVNLFSSNVFQEEKSTTPMAYTLAIHPLTESKKPKEEAYLPDEQRLVLHPKQIETTMGVNYVMSR